MTLYWKMNADWTTAGTFDTSRNDAERMVDYKLVRGRRSFISPDGNGLEAVEPGMVQITLDNHDGIYDPYNTSSVLYPKVAPGRYIDISVTNSSTQDSVYTKVLMHCNGAGGAINFVDESDKYWTNYRYGMRIDQEAYKFGGGSGKASYDSYLMTNASEDFNLGSGDWSWDFWVRFTVNESNGIYFVRQGDTETSGFEIRYNFNLEKIICKESGAGANDWEFSCPFTDPVLNHWYHICVGRNGNTPLIFIDGWSQTVTQTISISGKTADNHTDNLIIFETIAVNSTIHPEFNFDEVRFLKGACAYTANFTPPTGEYTGVSKPRFRGMIDSIKKIGDVNNPQILITAYDGLKELQDNTITTPIISGGQTGENIKYLTTSAEWPSIYGTSSIHIGFSTIPYMWAEDKSVFQTIKDLADAEGALFCANANGAFYFRPRQTVYPVIAIDQSVMLKDILLTSPHELYRNRAKVPVYYKSLPESSPVKLWKLNDVPLVSTAAGLTVWGRFKYNDENCIGYNMVPPADTTDFLMNNLADGTGTDKTSLWNVTTTYFGEVSKNVISADGANNNHYCTLLQNRGQTIISNEATYMVFDYSGTAAVRRLRIDTPFIQTGWQAEFYDSFMSQLVNTNFRFPVFQMEDQPEKQFGFDLFDKITLTISKYGINGDYIVGGIEEEWLTDNGQAVRTTVYTEPDIVLTPPGLIVP